MGLLDRFFTPKLTDSDRFERLEAKIRELSDIQEKQGRTIKGIELEWEQVYDKVTHLMARITKRQKTADRENALPELTDGPQQPIAVPDGPQVGTHARLAEMRRRNGLLPR